LVLWLCRQVEVVRWVAATVVGVAWVLKGGHAQTSFPVVAFVLTVGTWKFWLWMCGAGGVYADVCIALLALLAIVS
jgi:hypothetical protein